MLCKVHIQSLLIHHLTSIWGAPILCKDTVADAGDATMSFVPYPVGTHEVDCRQTCVKISTHFLLCACNLWVASLNTLYL